MIEPRAQSWSDVTRRVASRFFLIQAIAGASWWSLLLLSPASRVWFFPTEMGTGFMRSLLIADLLLYSGGSLLVSRMLARTHPWSRCAAASLAGIVSYATLLSLGMSITLDGGWLGSLSMLGSLIMTLACVWLTTPGLDLSRVFRHAPKRSALAHTIHMLLQAALFWGVLLFAIPALIHRLELRAGVPVWEPGSTWRIVSAVLFATAGSVGLGCGLHMSTRAEGTPVPLSSPSILITHGVYRYVRNPMAIAGLAQGLAVALWHGSASVLVYVVAGMIIWNEVARPLEEHDLEAQFGDSYRSYKSSVRCWIPRLKRVDRQDRDEQTETPTT
ncbi:MAG: methyltransferase family protein [Planctomycetota bacterium]|jgi:protein-S-isoprenylcysteine O-methyltransferase Ste14